MYLWRFYYNMNFGVNIWAQSNSEQWRKNKESNKKSFKIVQKIIWYDTVGKGINVNPKNKINRHIA